MVHDPLRDVECKNIIWLVHTAQRITNKMRSNIATYTFSAYALVIFSVRGALSVSFTVTIIIYCVWLRELIIFIGKICLFFPCADIVQFKFQMCCSANSTSSLACYDDDDDDECNFKYIFEALCCVTFVISINMCYIFLKVPRACNSFLRCRG